MKILKSGYYYFGASFGSRKNRKAIRIHKALMETFVPNPNNYPIINHIDGNKLNNSLDNLEWCTVKYNNAHAASNRLFRVGEDCFNAKLTENDVIYILENYIPKHKEFGCMALAKKFNIDHSIISGIISRKRWKHVKLDK